MIQVDREASARYGLQVADVNAVVQAAVGGQAVTQVYEGERLFDLVVRFLPEFRQDVDAIGNILVSTPDGARIPLKQVASITTQTGAFIIYRENNERYIPIKFSVRDRDLQSTVEEAQQRLAKRRCFRNGIAWNGPVNTISSKMRNSDWRRSCRSRCSSFFSFGIFRPAFDARCRPGVDRGAVFTRRRHYGAGGDRHPFQDLRRAVGFISLFGVAVQGALILISRIQELVHEGRAIGEEAIMQSAEVRSAPSC